MRNMFFIFLRQSVNWKLWLCGVITTLIMSSTIVGLFAPSTSVWYLLSMAMGGSGAVNLVICILPILPYGGSMAEEYETGIMRYYTIRTGRTIYFVNKIIVSFISGFLTMFLAQLLFIVIFMQFYPLFGSASAVEPYGYELMMVNGEVGKAFLVFMVHLSLSGAFMAVIAVFTSAVIPNQFAAISVPVIVYFTFTRIIVADANLPKYLKPSNLIANAMEVENPYTELLVKFCTILVFSAILVILGNPVLKRRIADA